jgi:hypothetical protein
VNKTKHQTFLLLLAIIVWIRPIKKKKCIVPSPHNPLKTSSCSCPSESWSCKGTPIWLLSYDKRLVAKTVEITQMNNNFVYHEHINIDKYYRKKNIGMLYMNNDIMLHRIHSPWKGFRIGTVITQVVVNLIIIRSRPRPSLLSYDNRNMNKRVCSKSLKWIIISSITNILT